MQYFLITLAFMGVALLGMAVGVIFSNRKLKGSCGGLGDIMGEDCLFCEKKDQCEKKKEREATQDLLETAESITSEHSQVKLMNADGRPVLRIINGSLNE